MNVPMVDTSVPAAVRTSPAATDVGAHADRKCRMTDTRVSVRSLHPFQGHTYMYMYVFIVLAMLIYAMFIYMYIGLYMYM